MYKYNVALNNQQVMICHKTQPNQSGFLELALRAILSSLPILKH